MMLLTRVQVMCRRSLMMLFSPARVDEYGLVGMRRKRRCDRVLKHTCCAQCVVGGW